MIQVISQKQADRTPPPALHLHCISPYLNPAHVLAPPRHWVEALAKGEFSWAFFRFRYKSLLRKRFNADPERFNALLDASEGSAPLILSCHCEAAPCHRYLARAFLEHLREQRPSLEPAPALRPKQVPPARNWAHRGNPGVELALLIEHPHQATPA